MNPELEARLEQALGFVNLKRVLFTLLPVTFLIAWNRGVALLYGLFVLVLAVLTAAYIAPTLNLRGVTVRRRGPTRVDEGETFVLTADLGCNGWLSRQMLQVVDRVPFAEEGHQEPSGFIPHLRREASVGYRVRAAWRGRHVIGPVTLRSSFPLGVHVARREVPDSTDEILVYPTPFPIARLSLLPPTHMPSFGARPVRRNGGQDEVFGIREYRRGDSPRHIHWGVTARRGELMVREFETLNATEVLIVLDLNRSSLFGEERHTTVEYAVKIAASVARYCLDHGYPVGLYARGAETIEMPPRCSPEHYDAILARLATVQADGDTPYQQVVAAATSRRTFNGVPVLFEAPPLKHSAGDIPTTGGPIGALRIRFDSESFAYPLRGKRKPSSTGPNTYLVARDDSLTEVFAR